VSTISATRTAKSTPAPTTTGRDVIYRTRGRGHGEVFRLMSPSDLGEKLKPFVFLDSFGGVMSEFVAAGGMHPHSGIGTVTVFTLRTVASEICHGRAAIMRLGGASPIRTCPKTATPLNPYAPVTRPPPGWMRGELLSGSRPSHRHLIENITRYKQGRVNQVIGRRRRRSGGRLPGEHEPLHNALGRFNTEMYCVAHRRRYPD
jgi:hypothetical protein